MNKIILGIVAIFFLIGASDYLKYNRFKLGEAFEDGIKNMGPLAISMVGILSLTPIIGQCVSEYILPLIQNEYLDPSIISSSILAIDMGALNLAKDLSISNEMLVFSGVLMSSMVGCTISFTLPLALGIVKDKDKVYLSKGMLCGIATLPIGLFVGGLLLKINIKILLINLIPIIIVAILLSLGLMYKQALLMNIFNALGRGIVYVSIFGLMIQGIQSIMGITIIKNLMPLGEALTIVGKIAIFLGGAYVMLEWIKRTFSSRLDILGKRIGVNSSSIAAFLGSLASAIVIFSTFDKLDDKGKVVCSAFAVGGAYVFGGQMGYVASEIPEYLTIYIFTKLLCGALAMIFAIYILRRDVSIK
ncbi:MAG: ethanolamine utilization protein EutH [Clostridium sp.]